MLLATFDGARHLRPQLDSIAAQRGVDWALRVSDDGSSDGTMDILAAFADEHADRDIRIVTGPKRGVARNFLSMIAAPDLPPAPVALSDQDDVWMPDRLARALSAPGFPMLYGSATMVCDEHLENGRLSRPAPPATGFARALAQNVIAGNTMVLSVAACQLLRRAMPQGDIPFHDWWIYQIITGAGQRVHIDAEPGLYYRQHGRNTLGDPRGARAMLSRLHKAFDGDYGKWLAQNTAALTEAKDLLTPENRALLAAFGRDLGRAGPARILRMKKSGIHRESLTGTIALYAVAGLGRI